MTKSASGSASIGSNSGSSKQAPSLAAKKLPKKTPTTGATKSPVDSPSTEPDSRASEPAQKRVRIISIANQKGGVGKSTTAVSLGAALAELGHRVLVIDLDPQGNASTGLGIKHEARAATIYDVLSSEAPIESAIVETAVKGLSGVPSTIDLAGAEIELVSQFSRELRLRKALEPLRADSFDFVFLDCPPSLGLLTVNALAAAEELIVPIQCEYYALEGLGQLLHNVRLVQQNINAALRLTGIIMTMFDSRTKLSEQVVEEVRRYFGDRVYDVIIPRTVRLSEAPGYGQPITVYDPRSRGAETYRLLAKEVAERPIPEGDPMPLYENLPSVIMPQGQEPSSATDESRPTPDATAEAPEAGDEPHRPETTPGLPDEEAGAGQPPAESETGSRSAPRADARPDSEHASRSDSKHAPPADSERASPSEPPAARAEGGGTAPVAEPSRRPTGRPAQKPTQKPRPKPAPRAVRDPASAPVAKPSEEPAEPSEAVDIALPTRGEAFAEAGDAPWIGTPESSKDRSHPTKASRPEPSGAGGPHGRRVVVIDERAEEAAVNSGQEDSTEGSNAQADDDQGVAEIGETLPQEPRKRKWWQFGKGGER